MDNYYQLASGIMVYQYMVVDKMGENYSGDIEISAYVIDPDPSFDELKDVECPVTKIHELAFYDCTTLRSVAIPSTVTEIGMSAFADCVSLEEVNIPSGVTTIQSKTFSNCKHLKSIIIPPSVTAIGSQVFSNCDALKSLTIPGTVEVFLSGLSNCDSLLEVNFEDSEIPLRLSSFGCPLGDNVESLYWGRPIVEEDVPNNINLGGLGLKSVVLGSNFTYIPKGAFSGCKKLTNVQITAPLEDISESAFSGCSSLGHIILPKSIKTIGKAAFSGCSNLKGISSNNETGVIELPEDITNVGSSAFAECSSIRELIIPTTCKVMEKDVFKKCYNIVKVTSYAITPPLIENSTFANAVYNNATLQCPTPEQYQLAEGWKNFQNILNGSSNLIEMSVSKKNGKSIAFGLDGRIHCLPNRKGVFIINGKKILQND